MGVKIGSVIPKLLYIETFLRWLGGLSFVCLSEHAEKNRVVAKMVIYN